MSKLSPQSTNRNLAIFLDGTWNTVGSNTNVWRLRSLCADQDADQRQQILYYDRGVNGLIGGTWGKGLSENIKEAYTWLVDTYQEGDQIFIFGFSRGAYTARSLAGFISVCGLLKPGGPLGVDQIYKRYRREGERTIFKLPNVPPKDLTLEEQWMLKYSRPVPIEMVGVWDTVGALGVPAFNIPGISRSTMTFHHTGLRKPVKHGFQALAIDEHRAPFAPTFWTIRTPPHANSPTGTRSIDSVEQRWFIGAHANVGGGYSNDTLAQLPLQWMVEKAAKLGLAFRNPLEFDGDEHRGTVRDSYKEFFKGTYSLVKRRDYRLIGAPPTKNADGVHTRVHETIDTSVFERWRDDRQYRPPSLISWAKRFNVDPAEIPQSVLANSPYTPAPEAKRQVATAPRVKLEEV